MAKKMMRKVSKFRKAEIKRKTFEVDIKGEFNIDGSGQESIKTPIEPLNHLLTLFAFHGLFDLHIEAKGDLEHHIIEDIGIALGKAFKESLGSKSGINRYGSFSLVMDETVVEANIDISGRPTLQRACAFPLNLGHFDNTNFTFEDAEEFLKSFTQHAGISLVYIIKTPPSDLHHLLEALFKAMGKALEQATRIDPRRNGIPSTKGIID
jgi:imidazoleglycerol-phosphate dehydratase